MGTIADLVPRVREALSVDSSYDAEIIPFGIKRSMTRLLRDYHFPLAVQQEIFAELEEGAQDYELPVGFKKELLVMFYDNVDETYSAPLEKVGGFTLEPADRVPANYWLWQGNISTDVVLTATEALTTELVLWYESMDWESNEEWFIDTFPDILFTHATFKLAAERNKPELAQLFGALWADEQQSLAIYANELEFDNGVYMQRPAVKRIADRYPAS